MPAAPTHRYKGNIFHKMRPLHRVIAGAVFALPVYFIANIPSALLRLMLAWDIFSFVYILCCAALLFTRPVQQIKQAAANEDGSDIFVATMIIISAFVSMTAVGLLLISKNNNNQILLLLITISGMALSWLMVHTIFIFHYAHSYYGKAESGSGLDFPGEDNTEPDYFDFAYFSFVIGCTFQVSDVAITSHKVRKLALLHGLLSFLLNTFVVALTINMIAGLTKS